MAWLPAAETHRSTGRRYTVYAVHCDVHECNRSAVVAPWRGDATALRLTKYGWVFTNPEDDGRDLCPEHAPSTGESRAHGAWSRDSRRDTQAVSR